MKIQNTHYTHLKNEIEKLPREQVLSHKEKQLGNDKIKRFVWDLFSAASLYNYASDVLYDYLNDNHIETALCSIARELKYI